MEILIGLALITIIFLLNKKKDIPSKKNYTEYDSTSEDDTPYFYDRKLTKHNLSKTFKPYKIVENDNALKTVIPKYEIEEKKAKKQLEETLGKALPNDIKWSIFEVVSLDSFLKNHKLFINIAYQRGLLLQKEKKYKDAIAHYSMGLYYLMSFYPHKFNPSNHIIDYVQSDEEVIEMGQYKFINKIKLCVKYSNINLDDLLKAVQHLISKHDSFTIPIDEFIQIIMNETKEFYLKSEIREKEEFDYTPHSFRDMRKDFRAVIRTLKKEKKPLEEALNSYYQFCVMQQILYGYYPLEKGVNGYYMAIIEKMKGNLKEKVKNVSFLENGYILKSEFISNNDYKTFIKVFGDVKKETDFKALHDGEFNSYLQKESMNNSLSEIIIKTRSNTL